MLITHIVVGFNMFQLRALHVRLRHRALQTDHGDLTGPEDPVRTKKAMENGHRNSGLSH